MDGITIALSKGRIFEETLPLLAAAGIEPLENPETSRKLIIATNRPDVRVVIAQTSTAATVLAVPVPAVFAQADGQTVVVRVGAEGAQEVVPVTVGDIVGGAGGAGSARSSSRSAPGPCASR